jgi:hypothetical protein
MFIHNPRTMGRPSSGFGRLLGGLFRVQWTGDFLTGQSGESLTGPDNDAAEGADSPIVAAYKKRIEKREERAGAATEAAARPQ